MFLVVDPVGLVPMYLALVGSRTAAGRRRVALRAVLVAGAVLFAFAIGGNWLLGRLGISLEAFRVAGGVLLFRIAVRMVFAQHERETKAEQEEARGRQDVSVFPLGIPIIAASLMILVGEARPHAWGLPLVLGLTAVVLLLSYLALRLAERLGRLLGQTGVNVVTRVLGILLAALAVQYVADGVIGLLSQLR